MKRKHIFVSIFIIFTALFASCAQHRSLEVFTPLDLNSEYKTGEYAAKVDNFIVILDSSSSMILPYQGSVNRGHSKFTVAKDILKRMNNTMPEMDIYGSLVTYGNPFFSVKEQVAVINRQTPYSRADFEDSIDKIIKPSGNSPAGRAIENIGDILKDVKGTTSIILVSDGDRLGNDPLEKSQNIKNLYSDKVCFHTIFVGNNIEGKRLLKKISKKMGCGISVTADNIATNNDMRDFVKDVFLITRDELDSDGDGVKDSIDNCPGTKPGVVVDEWGCPKVNRFDSLTDTGISGITDSDGDGVFDEIDECPNTPKDAIVDSRGCWVVNGVNFDYKKADIKPEFNSNLDNIVKILTNNPGLRVRIDGHTDNIGSKGYNLELSAQRAQTVKNYLVKMGISAFRITTNGMGFAHPIATNETKEGRAKNRRAELIPIK